MLEIKKGLRLNKIDYYKAHLSIINCLIPVKLTPKEMEVLAMFMSLDLDGVIARYRFGTSAKKIVMKQLNLCDSGLSNYIVALVEKGFLYKDDGLISILPLVNAEPSEQLYTIKLINEG